MTLMESLFVFILQDRAGEPGFDINRETQSLLTKTEASLTLIKDFNKQVPLTWIIRCSARNMSISPKEISGGEDWFVFYRDYWRRRVELIFADYMRDRRRLELLDYFATFLKGANLEMLENTASDTNPEGLPIKGVFALSFLKAFYKVVFVPDINRVLKPVLIDGEFLRKENRAEFAEAFNTLIKLDDDIKKFVMEISPVGDYGKRHAQARKEMSSLPIKRRKIQIVLEEASEDAEKILYQARDASTSMVNVLNGILGKNNYGKYEPLSNHAKIAGKGSQFNADLVETVQRFQTVVKILNDMEAMESGR